MPVTWLLGTNEEHTDEAEDRVKAFCAIHGFVYAGMATGGNLEEVKYGSNGIVALSMSSLGSTASEICAFADEAFSLDLGVFCIDGTLSTLTTHGRLVFHSLMALGRWDRELREEREEIAQST
jgi:DNA invertase Pin-like site-specific DNA recombinase